MRHIEIPLLRESAAFAARLIEAASRFGDAKYQFHRRVNWSHRYDETFYERESDFFRSAPDAYLAGNQHTAPQLVDVFVQKLRPKQVVTVLMKVAAHWIFHVLGSFSGRPSRMSGVHIYRKCYVDDIELVFDPEEIGVVRAVYPFPISVRRQFRYLRFLREKGYRFKLAGYHYSPRDLVSFLARRDVRSLQQLESRAQVRHAYQVVALGIKTIQLSDEFDIGSLDFARTLARFPVRVINSAHGVGKYFPVHAYQEFHVVTERQAQYYHAVRPCCYTLRTLNDKAAKAGAELRQGNMSGSHGQTINFVFLSQVFDGVGEVIASNEAGAVARLNAEFAGLPEVRLLYRPHPNKHQSLAPEGFELLLHLEEVNGHSGTVFASFFSTCQIDPSFKGCKVLLRGELIYPAIAFDNSETIVDLDGLVDMITRFLKPQQTNMPLGLDGL
ncbi:hypothetical protein [Polaromonas sp. UC242_47]|uniref:hypothetical protein n=1 Tax=Polaromonas sp. UC242_47 TaxID=3374626 RepID=UPI0037B0EBE4